MMVTNNYLREDSYVDECIARAEKFIGPFNAGGTLVIQSF